MAGGTAEIILTLFRNGHLQLLRHIKYQDIGLLRGSSRKKGLIQIECKATRGSRKQIGNVQNDVLEQDFMDSFYNMADQKVVINEYLIKAKSRKIWRHLQKEQTNRIYGSQLSNS